MEHGVAESQCMICRGKTPVPDAEGSPLSIEGQGGASTESEPRIVQLATPESVTKAGITTAPVETRPTAATYYLTDVLRSWPEERQREHLRDLNYPTLWSISMHEVFPGHFLHFQQRSSPNGSWPRRRRPSGR